MHKRADTKRVAKRANSQSATPESSDGAPGSGSTGLRDLDISRKTHVQMCSNVFERVSTQKEPAHLLGVQAIGVLRDPLGGYKHGFRVRCGRRLRLLSRLGRSLWGPLRHLALVGRAREPRGWAEVGGPRWAPGGPLPSPPTPRPSLPAAPAAASAICIVRNKMWM
eukprot:1181767-Prorocentrum_minimum.AAC.3